MFRSIGRLYEEAFRGLPAPVWKLSFGLLVNRAGTMVLPFLSLYLIRELGFEASQVSLVLLVFGLGSVIGSYAGGALSGSLGTLWVQVWSLSLAGVGFLILGQLRSLPAVALGVFLISAISDAFRPACLTAMAEAAPGPIRARAMGLLRLAGNLGMAIGPALGGLLAEIDYQLIFIGESATCLAAAGWLWMALRGSAFGSKRPTVEGADEAEAVGSLWRDRVFLGILALTLPSAVVLFQLFSTFPVYLSAAYGLGEKEIGLIFALNAGLIVTLEMPLIKTLERRPPAPLMGVGMLLLCLGFGLLPFGSGWFYLAFTVVVWTFGEMLMLPFAQVFVAERAGPGRTGKAMGIYASTFASAMLLAPALGFWIYESFGAMALWVGAGSLGIPLCLGALLLARGVKKETLAPVAA